jgi:hypothetical protein
LVGSGPSWGRRAVSYFTWDAAWYAGIVESGYSNIPPPNAGTQTNLAFFPAYPTAAALVRKVLPVSIPEALFLVSRLSALLFWWLLLRFLKYWKASSTAAVLVIGVIFCQPAAFYLVVPYADCLFLATLVGFLFLGPRAGTSSRMLLSASAAAYVMTASRLAGALLAMLPLLWLLHETCFRTVRPLEALRRHAAVIGRYAVLSISVVGGTATYLIYCWLRFGHWDQYIRARSTGWGVAKTNFFAAFLVENLRIQLPDFGDGMISVESSTRLYVALVMWALILLPLTDWWLSRRKVLTAFGGRAALYLAAWLLFFVHAAGSELARGHYTGFLRYGFYCVVPLVMACVHAYSHSVYARRDIPSWALVLFFLACALGLAFQLQIAYLYTHGVLVS